MGTVAAVAETSPSSLLETHSLAAASGSDRARPIDPLALNKDPRLLPRVYDHVACLPTTTRCLTDMQVYSKINSLNDRLKTWSCTYYTHTHTQVVGQQWLEN